MGLSARRNCCVDGARVSSGVVAILLCGEAGGEEDLVSLKRQAIRRDIRIYYHITPLILGKD